jgi:hypothetical protein
MMMFRIRSKKLKFSIILIFLVSLSAYSQSFVEKKDGVHVDDNSFPWELVIDRGKILGCIYDNRFYSLGSILILESLPRKCGLAADRNGIWEAMSGSELSLFKDNMKIQQEIERESTYIGNAPINQEEARLIRYLRQVKRNTKKEKN